MQYKVGIIGKFGAGEEWHDGQTVKTKNLTMLLEQAGNVSIAKVDTCYFRKNNLKLVLDTLRCLFSCDHIFLMVAENGMKFYLPLLHYVNKVLNRKIYHYIIGSDLLRMVDRDKSLIRHLNALDVNWFEYESGTQYLRIHGVKNASTLANFKLLTPVEDPIRYDGSRGLYRFCTFSRVMEEKGITEAIETIARINVESGKANAVLDIYGPVDPGYENALNQLLSEHKEFVHYKGIVDSQKSVDTLKQYYALLFPTKWPGEGVPGTIIDAFAAGLPVIASDWNANGELIQHKNQGILYPNDEMETLEDAVLWAIGHEDDMVAMRHVCRKSYTAYDPETIAKVIFDRLKGNGAK